MAKTQKQRDQEAAEKRKRLGEEELRHRVRPGTKQQLADLMAWNGITEQAEAIQLLIMNAHAKGPDGSGASLSVPRHDFSLSENVARELYNEGARQAAGMDRREV